MEGQRISLCRAIKSASYAGYGTMNLDLDKMAALLLKLLQSGAITAMGMRLEYLSELKGEVDIPIEAWQEFNEDEFLEAAEFETFYTGPEGWTAYLFPTISVNDYLCSMWDAERDSETRTSREKWGGGRPAKYDWDAIWIATCRAIYVGDLLPETITVDGLAERMLDICRRCSIREPDFETMRPKARRLLKALREGSGNES